MKSSSSVRAKRLLKFVLVLSAVLLKSALRNSSMVVLTSLR
jgi:hypothetical protein